MKIEAFNLNKDISEKYCWEYLYKGLLFFLIGNFIIWYKVGGLIYAFMIWFGKFTWKMMEKTGKNYEKKNKKRK